MTSANRIIAEKYVFIQADFSMTSFKQDKSFVLIEGSVGEYKYTLEINSHPTIESQLTFKLDVPILDLSARDLISVWYVVKRLVVCINNVSDSAMRYAAGTDGGNKIHLFPLQALSQPWKAITFTELTFTERYPGYLTTKSGPHADKSILDAMQKRIIRITGWSSPSFAFSDATDNNLFARLVRGEIPQWRVWEDENYVAFLTPIPNTPGFTVLIPRRHLSSDILSLKDDDYIPLVQSAYHVSGLLVRALGVKRVGMFFEGYEINYTHVKLVPVPNELEEGGDSVGTFYRQYPGFITTQAGPERNVELKFDLKPEDCSVTIASNLEKMLSWHRV